MTTITGTSGNDTINGTSSSEEIWAQGGNDVVNGNGGNDTIGGAAGSDSLNGGDGNDVLFGAAGEDTLQGGAGNDEIFGGNGEDELLGGSGDDEIFGGNGDDNLSGGAGADTFYFDDGHDDDQIFGYNPFDGDEIIFSNTSSVSISTIRDPFSNNIISYGIDAGGGDTVEVFVGFGAFDPFFTVQQLASSISGTDVNF